MRVSSQPRLGHLGPLHTSRAPAPLGRSCRSGLAPAAAATARARSVPAPSGRGGPWERHASPRGTARRATRPAAAPARPVRKARIVGSAAAGAGAQASGTRRRGRTIPRACSSASACPRLHPVQRRRRPATGPAGFTTATHNFCLPHASLRQPLPRSNPPMARAQPGCGGRARQQWRP